MFASLPREFLTHVGQYLSGDDFFEVILVSKYFKEQLTRVWLECLVKQFEAFDPLNFPRSQACMIISNGAMDKCETYFKSLQRFGYELQVKDCSLYQKLLKPCDYSLSSNYGHIGKIFVAFYLNCLEAGEYIKFFLLFKVVGLKRIFTFRDNFLDTERLDRLVKLVCESPFYEQVILNMTCYCSRDIEILRMCSKHLQPAFFEEIYECYCTCFNFKEQFNQTYHLTYGKIEPLLYLAPPGFEMTANESRFHSLRITSTLIATSMDHHSQFLRVLDSFSAISAKHRLFIRVILESFQKSDNKHFLMELGIDITKPDEATVPDLTILPKFKDELASLEQEVQAFHADLHEHLLACVRDSFSRRRRGCYFGAPTRLTE